MMRAGWPFAALVVATLLAGGRGEAARRPAPSPTPSPTPTASATASPSPVPLPSGLTADAIFLRARQVATARTQPRFVEYHIDTTYTHDKHQFTDRFDLRYRAHDDKVVGYTIPLSPDEDRKRLAGVNIVVFVIAIETNPNAEPITIRVPLLSPVSQFGLAVTPPTPAPDATPGPPEPPLQEIGRVATTTHEYDVTYVNTEPIDGRPTYHLSLKPVKGTKDLSRHQLRDLWVDQETFDVPQLRTAGILRERPYDRTTWTVHYVREGGDAWVIERVSTTDDMHFGDFINDAVIANMAFSFHDFNFPPEIPTALFDLAIP
jgi:hypothetical protein